MIKKKVETKKKVEKKANVKKVKAKKVEKKTSIKKIKEKKSNNKEVLNHLKYRSNKYYKIENQDDMYVFVNNIYKLNYEKMDKVFASKFKLHDYHNSFFEENVWKAHHNHLVFLSGVMSLKTKKVIIYYMEPYTRVLAKGEYDNDMYNRINNYFRFEQKDVKTYSKIVELDFNEFLFN